MLDFGHFALIVKCELFKFSRSEVKGGFLVKYSMVNLTKSKTVQTEVSSSSWNSLNYSEDYRV